VWKWEISLTFLVQKEEDKGRKPTVVTKLLQKSEETVSAMAYMQDFVNGEDFCPFIEEHTGSEIRRYHPGNFFQIS